MLEPLPIDPFIDEIRGALERRRALVLVAEPGSGKTTRVPPALLQAGRAIVLQPRRAAARAIARRIADERGWTLGREVGWHVRFERRFDASTRLILATEGILTARFQQDPLVSDCSTIVIDEFHERSIHADLALALSRQAMEARDDLRVVVMSATLDAESVAAFLGDCSIVRVAGRAHAVHIRHEPGLSVSEAVQQSLSETSGSVLCFEPGAFEIDRTSGRLRDLQLSDIDILPLHGSLPAADQDRALSAADRRRVIVSTNIAETSVTVPGVTAVVDHGLEKVARYDAERAIDGLFVERITQAAADQRAGRAGRTGPGVVYRLWPREDRLRPFREPEIQRVDLAGVVLAIAGSGGDARTLAWFTPPPIDRIDAAYSLLNRLGALARGRLTPVGERMLRFPLPPRLSRIIVEADGRTDAVRAAALLSERARGPFAPSTADTTESDLQTALDRWEDAPAQIRDLATQLARIASTHVRDGSSLTGRSTPRVDLRRALLSGYPDRVGQRRRAGEPRVLLSSGTGAVLTSQSGVRNADFIVALDVQESSVPQSAESRIRMASSIEREWLEPTSTDVIHRIDERGAVKAREIDRYDALILAERVMVPDPERAATLLAEGWLARPRDGREVQLLRRLRFAGVEIDIPAIVTAAAYQAATIDGLDIEGAIPHAVRLRLDQLAPLSIRVPSGRMVSLDYAEDGTVSASVKLQELFGLEETPAVGAARQPVLLSLLAPNGRPVQLTRDLRSFWSRTYPEVRKELRGRYPKHPWPEDPLQAVPTHRTKPRA